MLSRQYFAMIFFAVMALLATVSARAETSAEERSDESSIIATKPEGKVKNITFQEQHWFQSSAEDGIDSIPKSDRYFICLGGIAWYKGREQCVKTLDGFAGRFRSGRTEATVLPLQVFLEQREGFAVNIKHTSIIDNRNRKKLDVHYFVDKNKSEIEYVMPSRSPEHIIWDFKKIGQRSVLSDIVSIFKIIVLVITVCLSAAAAVVMASGVGNDAQRRRQIDHDERIRVTAELEAHQSFIQSAEYRSQMARNGQIARNRSLTEAYVDNERRVSAHGESKSSEPRTISTKIPSDIPVVKNKRKVIL